jgi:hypothetical protein
MTLSKAGEGSLLNRSPAPAIDKRAIVDDGAAAHVDTVVCIAEPRCNEVCA